MSGVFGVFDHCYVLNCDQDVDRMSRTRRRLARLGVDFERFPALLPGSRAVRFADPRIQSAACGSAATHAAVLRHIQKAGYESALILEDDAVFRDDTPEWMRSIAPQLRQHSWDLFYLGLHLVQAGLRASPNLGRATRAYHAHAYAVSRKAIPRALGCIERMLANPIDPFDAYQDDQLVKLYAIPILAIQEPNFSSTYGEKIDRLSQYFAVFDGDNFEQHCSEMAEWRSQWKINLKFKTAFMSFRRAYCTGPLPSAAASAIDAMTLWKEFEAEIQREEGFAEARRVLETGCTASTELMDACQWFYRTATTVYRRMGQTGTLA